MCISLFLFLFSTDCCVLFPASGYHLILVMIDFGEHVEIDGVTLCERLSLHKSSYDSPPDYRLLSMKGSARSQQGTNLCL